MRSRPIMIFMQARSWRAWAGSTSVIAVVTPLSISMSRVSSSRSRWRRELSKEADRWRCLRGGAGSFPGQSAGLYSAAHQVQMYWLSGGLFAAVLMRSFLRERGGHLLASILPIAGIDGQRLRLEVVSWPLVKEL